MIDNIHTKKVLTAALRANPLCLPGLAERRVAIADDGSEWQALIAVSREPQGYVYGHLFQDADRGCWRAILVFSTAAVMTAFEHASVLAYRRVVIDGLRCEPLYSWSPGDVSLLTADRRAGVRAMTTLIAGYSPQLVEPPPDVTDPPSLDGAIFEAYWRPRFSG